MSSGNLCHDVASRVASHGLLASVGRWDRLERLALLCVYIRHSIETLTGILVSVPTSLLEDR